MKGSECFSTIKSVAGTCLGHWSLRYGNAVLRERAQSHAVRHPICTDGANAESL